MRGEIVEGVVEFVCVRRVTVTEARVVGSDDVEFVGKLRDEIPEHMRRTRKAVQQNDGGCGLGSAFTIEKLKAIYGGMLERCHSVSFLSFDDLLTEDETT